MPLLKSLADAVNRVLSSPVGQTSFERQRQQVSLTHSQVKLFQRAARRVASLQLELASHGTPARLLRTAHAEHTCNVGVTLVFVDRGRGGKRRGGGTGAGLTSASQEVAVQVGELLV
jgi:hypothetical protein